jgi:hypothetical protein
MPLPLLLLLLLLVGCYLLSPHRWQFERSCLPALLLPDSSRQISRSPPAAILTDRTQVTEQVCPQPPGLSEICSRALIPLRMVLSEIDKLILRLEHTHTSLSGRQRRLAPGISRLHSRTCKQAPSLHLCLSQLTPSSISPPHSPPHLLSPSCLLLAFLAAQPTLIFSLVPVRGEHNKPSNLSCLHPQPLTLSAC